MEKILLNKKFLKWLEIALFIFALFLTYQILRKIFGGSWDMDDLTLSLGILNTGFLFTLVILFAQLKSDVGQLKSDHNHLSNQFKSLANDFKVHVKKS